MLDSLMSDLAKAREVERAALMAVNECEQDLERARAAANVATARVDSVRRRLDYQIDAQTDSHLDDPLPKKGTPENVAQFHEMLEGPEE